MSHKNPRALLYKESGQWKAISAEDFYARIAGVASALRGWGIAKGDRVALISENRPEWTIADFGILLAGAVVVPMFPTLTAEQTKFLLKDSEARAVFVSSEKQLKKIQSLASETSVGKIIVMDSVSDASAVPMQKIMTSVAYPDDQFESVARSIDPSDLASIIYTSGTTGIPKGVMLTHGNMASNLSCSLSEYVVGSGDISLSFLPLSHITARHLDFAVLHRGGTLAYVPALDQLIAAMKEMRPTFMVAVPRVYEKIHSQLEVKAKKAPVKWIYRWSRAIGKANKRTILAGKIPQSIAWKLANNLVYSKIRESMGGRVKVFISGGAPLGYDLADWYATMGIRIHEGYGLTETSPVIALNTPEAHKIGTVGKPLANVEVRIADDGEILVRGPSIFQSYWKRPEDTEAAFQDGWFKTGDVGNLDAEGFLSVTDRKKDLIKTSGGKFIAPQPIENSLKHNALIAEAVVFGDQRKSAGVLIAPNFAMLEKWAAENHISFTSRQELVENPEIRSQYQAIVNQVNANLADYEKLRKIILIAEELRVEDGMLTASMKLRRRMVEEKYQHLTEGPAPANKSGI
ncbi:MAG TPA: long-chain fatty acid--CoA ligase [Terriglobales bacterium]